LIVSNTFTNGDIFEELSNFNCPIYSYIHELRIGIEMYNGTQQAIENTLRGTQNSLLVPILLNKTYYNSLEFLSNKLRYFVHYSPNQHNNIRFQIPKFIPSSKNLAYRKMPS
jgi:hypothetical protein